MAQTFQKDTSYKREKVMQPKESDPDEPDTYPVQGPNEVHREGDESQPC